MMYVIRLFLCACLLASATALGHDANSQARYVGNEGVLVEHGQLKILFDSFYSSSYDRYVLVDEETSAAMLSGSAPYDGIDAIFVSHIHGDHFSVEPTMAYLRAQNKVQLYASKQVVDALIRGASDADEAVLQRLTAFDIQPGHSPAKVILGDIEIEVVAIPHSGGARILTWPILRSASR